MVKVLLVIGAILALKIGMDVLFLAKIDAFNRSNRLYYLIITFIETSFGIFGLSIVLNMVGSNYFYIFIYAGGAVLAAFISSGIKRKLDDKLEGQRKFFARITFDDTSKDENEVISLLKEHKFEMVVEKKQYISGRFRTVIQGSIENRKRMWELKEILRGRKGKHLVILRAEDIYYIP